MRRITKCLTLTVVLAGCNSSTDSLEPAAAAARSAFAAAGTPVDPSSLTPPPPPGAVCRADGPWTICHTEVSFPSVNAPVFDLPCGTVYETSSDIRHGIRWYNADNKIVKRFVTQDVQGTWSLSPEGRDRRLRLPRTTIGGTCTPSRATSRAESNPLMVTSSRSRLLASG